MSKSAGVMPEKVPDLSALSESDLFAYYRAIPREMKSRGLIRTENVIGDRAESLVANALGGQLAPNSEKSWDVLTSEGEKLQVKARVVSDPIKASQRQLGIFRSFDFDYAVIVLLSDADCTVTRAMKIPCHVIESFTAYRPHENGYVFVRPPGSDGPSAPDPGNAPFLAHHIYDER